MKTQYIIITIIILSAVFYIARTIYKNAKGHSCESGNCKCHSTPIKKV
ncbi:MAG: FeoB-associated Cys-rich membrane protein [Bacteroidia bacterium]